MAKKNIEQETFEFEQKKTIKGYPELHWTGKRPFKSTVYYPAQQKETYGEARSFTDKNGKIGAWINKIFWGDNLQVMSHLLRDFRGKVDLIYIDPPFDSKADYKKKIQLRGQTVTNDSTVFEEKQYGDIWTNDEYLQFMYERLILLKELLSEKGSIYLHCDWHKSHHLRMIMDEVFGIDKFRNEVVWWYLWGGRGKTQWNSKHDTLLFYTKNDSWIFNYKDVLDDHNLMTEGSKNRLNYAGAIVTSKSESSDIPEDKVLPSDTWYIATINAMAKEKENYPTQKPEDLLERIIKASTNSNDLVFDCFMGSGTTQAVAMKLGRRFIGADINLGAVQTTTKRLLKIAKGKTQNLDNEKLLYTGFEVYNVNNYDIFRNPLEARSILLQALEIEPFESSSVYDGEKDGRMYKIMPADVNRIATKADLDGFIANLPYKVFERKKEDSPLDPVLKLTVVCMGHEPDLAAAIIQSLSNYKVDIEVADILTDRKDLQFKRDAEGTLAVENGKLIIKSFYPLNLMQKLSIQRENVDEWRQLVESVMVDFNYDGAVLSPTVHDIPGRNELVKGVYAIPANSGTIRVKITDLLSESLELETESK
jgi:DNA modification methylase